MILFIRSHFVIDRSCTTIKLHISSEQSVTYNMSLRNENIFCLFLSRLSNWRTLLINLRIVMVFGICKKNFLPCPVHPALLHNFGCCYIILMGHKNIKIKITLKSWSIQYNSRSMLILRYIFVKIAPESLLHQARTQQFWKRGPMLLFANFYPIYTRILLNFRTPPWSVSVH